MPKRASLDDTIDPVRSRLAAAAAAPVAPAVRPVVTTTPANGDAVATAVGEGGDPAPLIRPAKPTKAYAQTVNRKILVTPEEAEQMEETADRISAAFGGRVNYSQISRAMWSVLATAEEAIKAGSRRAPKRSVPSKGNHEVMAEYEHALAEFLAITLKRS
jgi:hypothetical protein